jgi:Methyltransferase FkbM domain
MTTLDAVHWTVDNRTDRTNTLIKIDVEGGEMEVIGSGDSWLGPSNLFLTEAHYSRFLDPMRAIFAEHGLRLVQVNRRPLPVLGRERRQETNCWLVSDLGASA